ncbi:hypothetical protein [Actinoallomurus sp. NPDC050550]|uniref:hypothetical protein n=1 Tax=Actinoallomurus sp. NPDC050550 TaxID=3154937 RepID=UPI003407423B
MIFTTQLTFTAVKIFLKTRRSYVAVPYLLIALGFLAVTQPGGNSFNVLGVLAAAVVGLAGWLYPYYLQYLDDHDFTAPALAGSGIGSAALLLLISAFTHQHLNIGQNWQFAFLTALTGAVWGTAFTWLAKRLGCVADELTAMLPFGLLIAPVAGLVFLHQVPDALTQAGVPLVIFGGWLLNRLA